MSPGVQFVENVEILSAEFVEEKWDLLQADVTDIDSLKAKVDGKSGNTMAIISMSGFEEGAKAVET